MRRVVAVFAVVVAACTAGPAPTSTTGVSTTPPPSVTSTPAGPASTAAVPTPPTSTPTATTNPTATTRPPRPVTLAAVELVDAASGWGIAADGSVLRTFDAGRTWTEVNPAPGSAAYPVADFVDDRGWVVYAPADLLVVTDGGAQTEWVTLDLPVGFEVAAVAFADPVHGWVLADGPGGAGTIPVLLVRSDDGGHTWETVGAPPADDASAALQSGHSSGLGVTAEGRVWVTKSIGPRPEAWLAVSRDGGHTWTERVVPVDEGEFCGTAAPHPDGATFGALVVTCDGDQAFFAMTGDDGETWDVAALPGPVTGLTLYEDGAVAWGRKLYESIEPPGNWETLWTFGSVPAQVSMPDAVHGLAVVGDLLWWTGDGGDTWERLDPVLR